MGRRAVRRKRASHRQIPILRRPAPIARPFQLHLGQLTHVAIADCLISAQRGGREPVVDSAVIDRILSADPLRHDRRRGELLLRSFVRGYLESFKPPSPWRLDAAERRVRDGRIDLLYRHVVTDRVLADELKTARGRSGPVEPEDRAQVASYLADLETEFGTNLVGLRLVYLAPPVQIHRFRPATIRRREQLTEMP